MKSILSGVTLNQYLAPRTLVAKYGGLVFAQASGVFTGKEGPFVHLSSIVASNLLNLPVFRLLQVSRNHSLVDVLPVVVGLSSSGSGVLYPLHFVYNSILFLSFFSILLPDFTCCCRRTLLSPISYSLSPSLLV